MHKHFFAKRYTLVAFLATSVAVPILSQQVHWARQFGVSGYAYGNRVAAGEGAYVVGAVRDGEALAGQAARGELDAFIRRYDADGTVRFTRQFGTATNDSAIGAVYWEGYTYVVGYSEGSLGGPNMGSADGYLRKYDGYGNVLWTRQCGTPGRDEAFYAAAVAGRIYVIGGTRGAFPGFANPNGSIDTFLMAFDPSGNTLWTQQWGDANADDQPAAIAADNFGVFAASHRLDGSGAVRRFSPVGALLYTTATTSGIRGLAVDTTGFYLTESLAGDIVVKKFNKSTGAGLWTSQFGTVAEDTPVDMIAMTDAVYVGGNTSGAFPGRTNAGGSDMFAARLDAASGHLLWTTQTGGSGNETAKGIGAAYGYVYLAGSTTRWIAGSYELDIVTVKIATEPEWTNTLPGTPTGVAATADAVYAVGYFPVSTRTAGYLRKYNRLSGLLLWERVFDEGRTPQDIQMKGVAVAGSNVYVVGDMDEPFGFRDIFVQKYATNGAVLWFSRLHDEGTEVATGIAANADFAAISGRTEGGAFFGQPYLGGKEALLLRVAASSGALAWARNYGSAGDDNAVGVALTGNTIHVLANVPLHTDLADYRAYDANGTLLVQQRPKPTPSLGFLSVGLAAASHGVYVGLRALEALEYTRVFVSSYTTNGLFVWTRSVTIPSTPDLTAALATDNNFNYLAAETDLPDVGYIIHQRNTSGQPGWSRLLDIKRVSALAAHSGYAYAVGIDYQPFQPYLQKVSGPAVVDLRIIN